MRWELEDVWLFKVLLVAAGAAAVVVVVEEVVDGMFTSLPKGVVRDYWASYL
jgi:hypothetical protein